MFQGSKTDVVIIEGSDVVGAGCIELQFCIQYIQVDAHAALVTDRSNLVGFFCFCYCCFSGTNLFFICKNVQIILADFQFHCFTSLQEIFLSYFDSFFSRFNFSLCSTAIPDIPTCCSFQGPIIFINFGNSGRIPIVSATHRKSRHVT